MARVAIYARVSTDDQTTANQVEELKAWAARAGHDVVKVYEDRGISGTKGRDKRPGFDALLKGAVRREFDIIAVWSSDRLGRSMPHLLDVQKRGCRTLVECTPAYLGRDPQLLARLSEASGLQILTNTGYYGAAKDVAIPKHAYDETPQQLADRWTAEFEKGIEGTGIRPGFVKIGVDAGPLSPIDLKLVEAGALSQTDAHRSPYKNVLASALGGREALPETKADEARWDDVMLLCSDGLTRHVSDAELEHELQSITSSEASCRRLVDLALERGGEDNVTVVISRLRPRNPSTT